MTEKITKLIQLLDQKAFDSFKKNLFLVISEKIQEELDFKRMKLSRTILGEAEDADAAAEAEKQALFVDPNMAKEFFIKDLDYKGHVITLKTLGTGIGKPVVAYIDGQQFEIFTDKEVAERESKSAVERMITKGIDDLKDIRKSSSQLKKEAEEAKKSLEAQDNQEPKEKVSKDSEKEE